MAPWLSEHIERLESHGIVHRDELQPCSVEDLHDIETRLGVRLPVRYREFLEVMGRNASGFLRGSYLCYPDLLDFRDDLEELLREDSAEFELPPTALVFSCHQGYEYLYLDAEQDTDDPPVFHYVEGRREPEAVSDSFTGFVAKVTAELLQQEPVV